MRTTEYRIKAPTECLALVRAGPALEVVALGACVDCGDSTPVWVLMDTWLSTEATVVAADTAVFPALEAGVAVISGASTLSVAMLVLVVVAVTPGAAVLSVFVAVLVLVGVAVTPVAAVLSVFVAVLVLVGVAVTSGAAVLFVLFVAVLVGSVVT